MKKTEADKDMIQKLYEESTIASKVMQAIIKKANVTVTDDEAKTVKVYKLVFTTKTTDSKTGKEKDMTAAEKKDQLKKAKSALKMIKKGQSISSVAKKFSVNSDNEESYTKGKAALGTKFETAAAKLKKNQVSGVVELDDAYVIIKMLNPNDTTAAASNKSTLLQEKQQAAYEKVYKKWTKDADKKWDDKKSVDQDLWKEVKFKYKATTASTAATTTTTTAAKNATTAAKNATTAAKSK
jgi:foldase protein PrsA